MTSGLALAILSKLICIKLPVLMYSSSLNSERNSGNAAFFSPLSNPIK
ncbi:hypothetical protein ACUXLH_000189 [Staphylococcus haemolyticus]